MQIIFLLQERMAYILAGRMPDTNGTPGVSSKNKVPRPYRNASNSRNNNPTLVNSPPNGVY